MNLLRKAALLVGALVAVCTGSAHAANIFNCTAGQFVYTGNVPPTGNVCNVGLVGDQPTNWNLAGGGGVGASVNSGVVNMIHTTDSHVTYSFIYQTPVNVQAFTASFQFQPDGQCFALALQNNNNPNVDGGAAGLIGGAGGECDIYQGFGPTASPGPSPTRLWAVALDGYSPLTNGGSFSYSNTQIYQTYQPPYLPVGAEYISGYPTNKLSTSPVPLNNPSGTQGSASSDTFSMTITYDGSTVTENLYDVTAGGSCPGATCFTQTWSNVSIPAIVGSTTAYFGIMASTGLAATAPFNVYAASYTVNTPTATVGTVAWNANQSINTGSPSAYTPVFSVAPGSYTTPQTVSLTTSGTPYNYSCYTFVPTGSSITLYPYPDQYGGCVNGTPYSGPITISTSGTLYATAGANTGSFLPASASPTGLGSPSGLTMGAYTILPTAATPTFSPGAGTYFTTQSVSLAATSGPVICYNTTGAPATNGTTGCAGGSTKYTAPVSVSTSQTLYAVAGGTGFGDSPVASAAYTINPGCGTVAAGSSTSTIQSAMTACGSGNTLPFAAGTYSISSTLNVPCGMTFSGPSVTLAQYTGGDGYSRQGYAPTAVFNWSGGAPGQMFSYPSNCSTPAVLQLFECNMQHPSGNGGQCVYVGTQTSNLTITKYYVHGNQASSSGDGIQNTLILFDGGNTATPGNNNAVTYGRTGATGDCSNIMSVNTDYGGGCSGLAFHTNQQNLNVTNNFFYYDENGVKFYEGSAGGMYTCINCTLQQNDFSNFHRIAFEEQINKPSSSSAPTVSLLSQWNSAHDPFHPFNGTFAFSIANGCQNASPSVPGCASQTIGNTLIDNVATTGSFNGLGIEMFGSTGTVANYNLVQGEWSNSISAALDGAEAANGNHVQSSFGASGSNNPADCKLAVYPSGNFGWFGWNTASGQVGVNTPPAPTVANTCDFFDGSVQTSVAATMTPAGGGTFSGSQVVTFGVSAVTPLDQNTGIWYTLDGSTPVPGAGAAKYAASGSQITLLATTTVKAVGMWGAPNQPTAYPTGPLSGTYGWKASGVNSQTYTLSSGSVTLSSVTLATTGGVTSIGVGGTNQIIATCRYSDGSFTTCNTTDSHGNAVTSCTSSNTAAITVTSPACLATGVAGGSSNITAVAGGVTSSALPLSVTVTLTSVTLATTGGVSSIGIGATNQILATCHYSDSSTTSCNSTDSHGNAVGACNSSNTAVATITSPGCIVTGVGGGTTNLTATAGGVASSPLALTVAVTLSSVSITTTGGVSNIGTGATNQLIAACHYSDGSTTTCTGSVSSWQSSNTAVATVNSSGLVTGVAAGSTNLTATVSGITSAALPLTVQITFTSLTIATTGGVTSIQTSQTNQIIATCHYSDDSTTTCNSADSQGNSVTSCTSSSTATATITSPGCLVTGVAVGTTNLSATAGGRNSNSLPLSVVASPPTLSTVTLATTGGVTTITAATTNQILASCHYTDGSTTGCNTTDTHGNAVTSCTSSNTAAATISSPGCLATGVAPGTTNLTAVAGGVTSSPALPLTVSAAIVLSSVTLTTTGGITTLPEGQTNQLVATCHYSDGSNTTCNTTDSHGNAVTSCTSTVPANLTITSPGCLVRAVAPGYSTFTAVAGGVTSTTPVTITVPTPITLTGITLSAVGGVGTLVVGQQNQLLATCHYSDGSITSCNSTDSHGNVASTYLSSNPATATVSSTGLITAIAAGATTFTADAGSFISPPLPMTVVSCACGQTH